MKSWIGVDLDGTLAYYDGWLGDDTIGPPVEPIVDLCRALIRTGFTLKVFTARASDGRDTSYIERWTRDHLGKKLEVTCSKDYGCLFIIDDRAVSVDPNGGVLSSLNPGWKELLDRLGVAA